MYCENCGYKLKNKDLFCEECGTKINRTNDIKNNSNKTIGIILGCVFGGIFLLIALIVLFFILIFNTVDINDVSYQDEIKNIVDGYEEVLPIDSF